jgi:flagellar FliL protein
MAEIEIEEIKDKNGKSKKFLFVIIAVFSVLLLLVIILGFLYFVRSDKTQKTSEHEKTEVSESTNVTGMGPLYTFDTFVVNLNDPGGSRYLRMSMDVEADNNIVIKEIEERKPQLRDTVISILSSKSYADVSTTRGKLAVKEEIIRRFNLILRGGKLRNVYLTEFVVQ